MPAQKCRNKKRGDLPGNMNVTSLVLLCDALKISKVDCCKIELAEIISLQLSSM